MSAIRNEIFNNIQKSYLKKAQIRELLDYEQPTKYIVTNTEYSANTSLIPVLTANKAFILGYTAEQHGVCDVGECIIFDDFTMDMKYVNFSFKVKSSAIKILTARHGANLGYVFEYLQYLNLLSGEHKRHYISGIEPLSIPITNTHKQQIIANIFRIFDEKIKVETNISVLLQKQKQFLLREMFI